MRRVILLLLVQSIMLVACQSGGNQDNKAPQTAAEAVDTVQLSSDDLVKRVEAIYESVFKVYVYEDSLRNLDQLEGSPVWENRKAFSSDFCSRELNDKFGQINNIDSLYHKNELGFYEADYWLMGQDWGSDLHISDVNVVSMNGNEAVVELKIHNLGSDKPVRLRMLYEDGEWRIDTFIDVENDFDLKKEMSEYISKEIELHPR